MLSESWKTNVPLPSSEQRRSEPRTDTELKPRSYFPTKKTKLNPMSTSFLKKCAVFAFLSFPSTLVVLRRPVQGQNITPVTIVPGFLKTVRSCTCGACNVGIKVSLAFVGPHLCGCLAVIVLAEGARRCSNGVASAHCSAEQRDRSPHFLCLRYPPPQSTSCLCWESTAISVRP